MPITALPTPPQTTDPANFDSRADAWVSALQNWTTQANDLQTNVNAVEASATAAAVLASASAAAAQAAQVLSQVAAAYKGTWSGLTGALAIPASVLHQGAFWALTASLANVTTAEPGVSASWVPIVLPGGALPDQQSRNRELGSAAYIDIHRIAASGAGFATGVTAGTVQSVTITVPGLSVDDFVVAHTLSIATPANLRTEAHITAANTVRITYISDSGTVTPGAHTVFIRAERRFPE